MNEMIRQHEPVPTPSEGENLHPDLYLAGMRCAEVRSPTLREERLLKWLGYGGGTVGTLSALFLAEIFRSTLWIVKQTGPIFMLLVFASVIGLFFASMVAGPALQSLRRRKVYVFRGPVQSMRAFDANQKKLFANRTYPNEMVVLANRRTVLRSGSRILPRLEPLREPCAVATDRGPDTRGLTEAEKAELRNLIRQYRRLDASALVPLLLAPIFSYAITVRVLGSERSWVIAACFVLMVLALIYSRWGTWWAFTRHLRQDLREGVITNGKLWSGTPWLVDGEPAPWRMAQPDVGRVKLDVEALKSL